MSSLPTSDSSSQESTPLEIRAGSTDTTDDDTADVDVNVNDKDAVAAAHARLLAGTGGVAAVAGTGLTMLGSAGLGKHGVPGAHTTSALGAVAGVGHPPGSMGQVLAEMKAAGVGSTPAAPVAPVSTVDHTLAWMAVLPGKWTAEQIRKQDLHLQAPPRPELGGTPIPGARGLHAGRHRVRQEGFEQREATHKPVGLLYRSVAL